MAKPTLIIRADAAPRMGTGHVMRCLALAQAARRTGLEAHLVCRVGVPWVRERLAQESIPLHLVDGEPPVAESPDKLLGQLRMDGLPQPVATGGTIWVVTDGYHFTCDCQQAVRAAGYKLLVIDDNAHLPEYSCDILLNQNIGSEELVYHGDIGRKLLGLDYVLLRQEFLEAREKALQRERPDTPQKLLITLGGGDFIEHLEAIAKVMSSAREITDRTVRVLQGAMDAERIRKALSDCPVKLEILPRVDDMPSLLLDTDLCITAGGSTCWELLCLSVPFLTVQVAENQQKIVNHLSTIGLASFSENSLRSALFNLKIYDIISPLSPFGVYKIIHSMADCFKMRSVTLEDMDFLFDLANDNDIKAVSFRDHEITHDEHKNWFLHEISKKNPFYIGMLSECKCGYARYKFEKDEAEVSIAIAKEFRKIGIGRKLLEESLKKFTLQFNKITPIAKIKKWNRSSLNLFLSVGFSKVSIVNDIVTMSYNKHNFLV